MTTMNVEKRNMKKCNYSVSLRVLCDTGKHTCITQNLDNKVLKSSQYILFFGDVFSHLS